METEKTCEFCMLMKPVVYCEADAAHLCLSCDAKVHSANALSNRHPRTLVCEPCGYNLAYIRCSDHQMFMCRDCDRGHHDDLSSQHQRKVITSYIGCPSAKDLAALWGFGFKDLEFISTSTKTVNGTKISPKIVKPLARSSCELAGSDVESSGNHTKAFMHKRRENTWLILQQILDLEKLELSDGISNLTTGESQRNCSKFENQDWSANENPVAESFPLPLPDGDSFWQCKSPVQTSQLWPQNLQDDIGGYAELGCFDNSNMPDVDLTFQNFEELFNEDDLSCSSRENDSSMDTSDYSYIKKDISIRKGKPSHISVEHTPTIMDCPPPIRTNFSCNSHDSASSHLDSKENLLARHKEKKKARLFEKQARSIPRRARTNLKKQPIKARILKVERYEADAVNVSRSF